MNSSNRDRIQEGFESILDGKQHYKPGDVVPLPNGAFGIMAEYKDQKIPEYRGNPLIESLPLIWSPEEAMGLLAFYPKINAVERTYETHEKIHCVDRLLTYIQPDDNFMDLEQRISRMIRQGYVGRNPLVPAYAAQLQAIYRLLKNKSLLRLANDDKFRSSALTIIGESGTGKTTAVERILRLYPQVILHDKYCGRRLGFSQVVWLKLDAPVNVTVKALCTSFFAALDRVLGTDYLHDYGSPRNPLTAMMLQMAQLAYVHSVGLLVIDETQHIDRARKGGDEILLNYLVTLENTIGVPQLFVGTPKVRHVLQKALRQGRRACGRGSMTWKRISKEEDRWETLLSGMMPYQWTKKEAKLEEISQTLYYETQGIADLTVKLFLMAQVRAIFLGVDAMTPDIIHEVAEDSLQIVKPAIDAIRSNDPRKMSKFDDLDLDEVSVDDFVTEERNKYITELEQKVAMQLVDRIKITEEAERRLMGMGVDEKDATKLVEKAIGKRRTVDVETLAQHAMKLALEKKKRSGKNGAKGRTGTKTVSKGNSGHGFGEAVERQPATVDEVGTAGGRVVDPLEDGR